MANDEFVDAEHCLEAVPGMLELALGRNPRDFIALECCANDPVYAKPDTLKWLVLWQAARSVAVQKSFWKSRRTLQVRIACAANLRTQHAWLHDLVIQEGTVRFPCNVSDGDGVTLSWDTIEAGLLARDWPDGLRLLPRFSTASRSNVALIPESIEQLKRPRDLDKGEDSPVDFDGRLVRFDRRKPHRADGTVAVNLTEWSTFRAALARERAGNDGGVPRAHALFDDIGRAASGGLTHKNKRYRLYGIKTGVSCVGSHREPSKQQLEANSMLAISRSNVIDELALEDPTFSVQTEVLTITAPIYGGRRDGFQVRDLSGLKPGLTYVPGQAAPYVTASRELRHVYGIGDDVEAQVDYWVRRLAVPLGRAKACLFLKYGLVHTAGNAQNYVLGLDGGNALEHFVTRDIGDTSWHDTYLRRYRRHAGGGAAYTAYAREKGERVRQTLGADNTTFYQSPAIVRLAAYTLLTHGFDKILSERCGWSDAHLYRLASGVLAGFRAYIERALDLGALYPAATSEDDAPDIAACGRTGQYPYPSAETKAYRKRVRATLKHDAATLFARAAYVGEHGNALLPGLNQAHPGQGVSLLINTEELHLCAGLERLLGERRKKADEYARIKHRIRQLDAGAQPRVVE